ncbi:MAG: class I SAM-dependent methyltransferase [Candidatus Korobacteraceae bacterium]
MIVHAPGRASLRCNCGTVIYHRIVSPSPKNAETKAAGGRAWIRDTVRARGRWGALRYYIVGGIELLHDLAPSRRRSRYGDIDYDFDHGVDTTWATIPLRTRLREWLSGGQYQPSEPALFHQILRSLPVAPEGFTFIDLGSGKGRTLLMASDYAFRHIIGVELLDELDVIARQNITRYHGEQQKCFVIESRSGDAREFVFPHEPTVLYLFNPFPEYVMDVVLANLRNSLAECPRPVFVIYHNLVHERVLSASSWLHPVYRTSQFVIYRAVLP